MNEKEILLKKIEELKEQVNKLELKDNIINNHYLVKLFNEKEIDFTYKLNYENKIMVFLNDIGMISLFDDNNEIKGYVLDISYLLQEIAIKTDNKKCYETITKLASCLKDIVRKD